MAIAYGFNPKLVRVLFDKKVFAKQLSGKIQSEILEHVDIADGRDLITRAVNYGKKHILQTLLKSIWFKKGCFYHSYVQLVHMIII